jgi:DNA segregation ATPase FtsK/SpoIIIE-like protein
VIHSGPSGPRKDPVVSVVIPVHNGERFLGEAVESVLDGNDTLAVMSTGSGKSVLMQNIILAIACTNTPEQARIVLIDPKKEKNA